MCSHAAGPESGTYAGRVAILQRVLPAYRAPFFEMLGERCPDGLSIFSGAALPAEEIPPAAEIRGVHLHAARNVHFLDPSSKGYFCWQGGMRAWLEAWDPQLLVVEANPRYLSTPTAVRWMRQHGRPVLGWGLGAPAAQGVASTLLEPWRARFLRSMDGLIAYSRSGAQEYRRYLAGEKIFTALNAVRPRPEKAEPPLRTSTQPLTVLFVGRLQERKRIDLLLRACAALPAELQPELSIVGDGPARHDYEELSREVYPRARFRGSQRGAELERLFREAHLFVLPGTGGLAVQEALAYALPVIVARGDGTQEDLVREANGWLVQPDDLPALSAALRDALSDPQRLIRMGGESYRIARDEVNLEKMAESFITSFWSVSGY